MRRIVLFALFLLICATSNAGRIKSSGTQYSNTEYGFAIAVPVALPRQESKPPAPEHGTAIELRSGGRVWIDGSYDASFLMSAKAALSQIILDEGAKPNRSMKSRKLAGLEAAEISFFKEGKSAVRVVAFRPRIGAVPIIYTLGLDTDGLHANEDERIFNRIVRSFTLLPLPK